jgi:excinuclease UvrABC helicase subunit UvrB
MTTYIEIIRTHHLSKHDEEVIEQLIRPPHYVCPHNNTQHSLGNIKNIVNGNKNIK